MTIADTLTIVIAALGLGLGIVNLYLYLRERIPTLRVFPAVENKLLPVDLGVSREVPTLTIRMVNPTDKPIAIKAILVQPDSGPSIPVQQFHTMGWPMPTVIVETHRDYDFIVRGKDLLEKLQPSVNSPILRLRVIVEDEVNRKYISKYLLCPTDRLIEPKP